MRNFCFIYYFIGGAAIVLMVVPLAFLKNFKERSERILRTYQKKELIIYWQKGLSETVTVDISIPKEKK